MTMGTIVVLERGVGFDRTVGIGGVALIIIATSSSHRTIVEVMSRFPSAF